MPIQEIIYIFSIILASLICFWVALVLWKQRYENVTNSTGIALLISAIIWGLGYVFELISTDLQMMIFWDKIQFIGIAIAPLVAFIFILQFTGRIKHINRRTLFFLSLIPIITLILVFTNEQHGLIWSLERLSSVESIKHLDQSVGIGLISIYIFSFTLLFSGCVVLIKEIRKSPHLFRMQGFILISAIILIIFINLLDLSRFNPISPLELTPLTYSLIAIVIAWGLTRLQIGDIVSVSKLSILNTMRDSLLVLDPNDRILHLNPAAEELFDCLQSKVKGESIEIVWPEWSQLMYRYQDGPEFGTEVTMGLGSSQRVFDVSFSPQKDWRNQTVSQIIVLRDITELKRRTNELTTLLDSTKIAISSLELDQLTGLIAENMLDAFGASGCTISRYDRETDSMIKWIERRNGHPKIADNPHSTYSLDEYPTIREVLEKRQPKILHVSDQEDESEELSMMRSKGHISHLILPLAVSNRVIGIVEIDQSDYYRQFTPSDIRLAQAMTEQAAVVIENAEHHVDTENRLKEQSAIREASSVISSTLELTVVLNRITQQMCQLINATSAYLCSFNLGINSYIVVAEFISPQALEVERISDLGEIYQHLDNKFIKRMITGIHDMAHIDDPSLPVEDKNHMERFGGKTILYIPLISKGRLLGFVELWESRDKRIFTQEEIFLCRSIAPQAAIALDNAQLHTETQKRLRIQTALRESGAVLSSSLDPQSILRHLAEQICFAIDATSVYICTINHENKSSQVIAEFIGKEATEKERISDLGNTYIEDDIKFFALMETGEYDTNHFDDPELISSDKEHMEFFSAVSILYIPLISKNRLLGFIEIWESREIREFQPDEIELCKDIAQQAAIALENAQLYNQAQQEITERKRAEDELKKIVNEKEILLKEIHHRVKNNLQVIYSLLNLQAEQLDDPNSLDVLKDSQNRVRSMALIHEKLYQSENLAQINFNEYLESLVNDLYRSYQMHKNQIKIKLDVDEVIFGIDIAVPCSLLINELIANSLKYAFPDNNSGEINIHFHSLQNGHYSLQISDNGVGLPPDIDYRHTKSLGLQLVNTLVQQINGMIELDSNQGTAYRITFTYPLDHDAQHTRNEMSLAALH
jgi:PAS domain S-box-containing protein